MQLTQSIRELCSDYAVAMKWYIVEQDYDDDEWIADFIRRYVSVTALKQHYASDRLDLDEFELCLGLKLGIEPVPSECPAKSNEG